MSPLETAGGAVRVRGKGNGGTGAIQGDQSGASAQWDGASERVVAGVWMQELEEQSGGPGHRPAAVGQMAGSQGV